MAAPNKQTPRYAAHQSPSQDSTSPYAPRSPVIPSFSPLPQAQNLHAFQVNQNSYQVNPQTPLSRNSISDYSTTQYLPPISSLPPAHSFSHPQSTSQYYPPPPAVHFQQGYIGGANDAEDPYNPNMPRPSRGKNAVSDSSASFAPIKSEEDEPTARARASSYRNPNPHNIEIKTKFPVARIKRIMQADEEVGKVAQVTPVAVSKALELFMIALVTGAAEKAREKGGKRVTAQHLKMVVEDDVQFDFLGDIVKRVADVQEGAGGEGRRRKKRDESSESEEEESKKGKKVKGRRRKIED